MFTDTTRVRAVRKGCRLCIRPAFGFPILSAEFLAVFLAAAAGVFFASLAVLDSDDGINLFWPSETIFDAVPPGIRPILMRIAIVGCGLFVLVGMLPGAWAHFQGHLRIGGLSIELHRTKLVRKHETEEFEGPIDAVEVELETIGQRPDRQERAIIRLKAGVRPIYVGTVYSSPNPTMKVMPDVAKRIARFYSVPIKTIRIGRDLHRGK